MTIGAQLKRFPQVHCLESPIDQNDIEGYRRTDITALFMLQLAAATPNATRAHVTTSHLHEQSLLQEPLIVTDGHVAIPDRPGLGASLNLDVVEDFRIE